MTDNELKNILENEWGKWRPRIPMGERRIEFAIACMRLAYDLGRASVSPLPISYDDEVTPEQVKAIDEKLKPEFTGGDWKTVEKE